MAVNDRDIREQVGRVEGLLGDIEALSDERARAAAVEAVQGLLELYGEGLARIVEQAGRLGGQTLLDAFAEDELVSHLLLLHGLHPLHVEARVRQALDEIQPQVATQGANVDLLGVNDGVVHLRLTSPAGGCPSSAAPVRQTIEQAVQMAAPDVDRVEIVDAVVPPVGAGLVQLVVRSGTR